MPWSLHESIDWCGALTRRTAGNFYFSFLTLPADRRRDMCVLYAFMRVSDDLGDDVSHSPADRRQHLQAWRKQLANALENGSGDHPVFPALCDVVRRHRIPTDYLFAVIDGVAMDLDPLRFETFDELNRYCYHVAGAVGLCCIHIWGFRSEAAIPAAIDCGTAFQLTNILRDLGEDADMGRVYLPQDDLARFGFDLDDLKAHRRNEAFSELMRFEVARARGYYEKARTLFTHMHADGRPILAAMMRIYGGLLNEIERRDYDVFAERVRLPRWKKLWITADSVIRYRWLRRCPRAALWSC